MNKIKGYKAVRKDKNGYYTDGMENNKKIYWKKGKKVKIDGELELCENGIHFFRHLCFAVNYFGDQTRIFEIEVIGDIIEDTCKACTNHIKIGRLIPKSEIEQKIDMNSNTGKCNSGSHNSGSHNAGNYNSGNYNSGSHNSGNKNSGNYNSGNYNSGNENSGDENLGNYNSGDYNSGNKNSGNKNSGNFNSGDGNSGDYNSGDKNLGWRNSGNFNSGNYNSSNYNSGDENSGNKNSGNKNSGDENSGNYNSGDYNSGDKNTGNNNLGHYNTGDNNLGHFNTGNFNTGNKNSGNYNLGSHNSGNCSSGDGYHNYFCTETKYFLFDIEVSSKTIDKVKRINMDWFNRTKKTYKEAWAECPEIVLNKFRSIPEFQTESAKKKFEEITGLKLFENRRGK